MSSGPSTTDHAATADGRGPGAVVMLRDGERVRVRPIRASDEQLMRRAFERLSDESRYRRFLVPMPELSDTLLRYLTHVDHRDHEAMLAVDEVSGEGVGVARFVRSRERPSVAEAAVTVADDWQGRGVGTVLLDVLAARAREEGITRFSALALADNQEMMELLESLGPVRVVDRDAGTVEVEVVLPESGLSPELRGVLRLSASTGDALPFRSPPAPPAPDRST